MSETAPEAAPAPSSGGGVFQRKLGPLPLWAWMGIGLAVALGYYYFRQNSASSKAAQSAATQQAGGSVDSSLVPQFVNQTYVENQPPSAPPPPTNITVPPNQPAPAGQANQYPAPTGLKLSKLTGTTAKINWNYITGTTPKPTSYTIAVYQLNGKLAQQFTVNAPDTASGAAQATVTGLHPGWQYHVNVWANGGKVAPPHVTGTLTMLWPGHMSR
jgi:hypothetical protein